MQRNVLETVMGAVVLLAAAAFLFIVYSASGVKEASDGYHLVMRLDQGGSITPGTDEGGRHLPLRDRRAQPRQNHRHGDLRRRQERREDAVRVLPGPCRGRGGC
jgi:hypothetical protein